MKPIARALICAATATLLSSPAAYATPFTISSTSFTLGGGYGSGVNDQNSLDVVFTPLAVPATFNLSEGNSFSFGYATVTLNEVCINPGGCPKNYSNDKEIDDLSVTANFQFLSPYSGKVQNVSVTGATPGLTNDLALDYSIDFSPTTVYFGNGGQFTVDLADLNFYSTGTLTTAATITLVSAEKLSTDLPEPNSLALLGLGLAAAGVMSRMVRRS